VVTMRSSPGGTRSCAASTRSRPPGPRARAGDPAEVTSRRSPTGRDRAEGDRAPDRRSLPSHRLYETASWHARPVDRLGHRGAGGRQCAAPLPVISFGRGTSIRTSPTSSTTRRSSAAASARPRRGRSPRRPRATGTMPHSLVLISVTRCGGPGFDRDLEADVPRIVLVDTSRTRPRSASRRAALGDRLYGSVRHAGGARPGDPDLVHEVRARSTRPASAREDRGLRRADARADGLLRTPAAGRL